MRAHDGTERLIGETLPDEDFSSWQERLFRRDAVAASARA